MKLWFDYCRLYSEDDDVRLGIGWYKHHSKHKWYGFTVIFYIYPWKINLTFVSNYTEYEKIINRRFTRRNPYIKDN